MIPSKSKRSESRRSSILKPRKPRQPLQNVNLDSSSNENSPATSKIKRRVSFAEKKHVKEFCHSTEQGTVWDNTYEEHDFSLKGSFTVDQNSETESKENTSLYTSRNDDTCTYFTFENNSTCLNNSNLANNQLLQKSIIGVNEESNKSNCDLDFTNPIKSIELFDEGSQFEHNASTVSHIPENTISDGIVVYNDTDDKCKEPSDKEYQQTAMPNASAVSKNANIIYRDSDEENCGNNNDNKYYSEPCFNNVNFELDKSQDLSMEFTTPILASLSSSHAVKQQDVQKNDDTLCPNNLDKNYTTNCNNVSMEITQAVPVPISVKSTSSDLATLRQIPLIVQSCKNADTANTHDNTIFSMNLQSNIVSKSIIPEQTQDVKYVNDSMILTTVIQPFATDIDMSHTNTASNTLMEMTTLVSSNMHGENIPYPYNENIVKENDLRKDQTDKTEFFNDVLMEMTMPVNVALSTNTYDKENLRVDEPISRDDRTIFFHNVSMEMTTAMSVTNKQGTTDTITLSEENAREEKDKSTCFNRKIKPLCKPMEFTEAVPIPSYHKKTFNAHVAQSTRKSGDNKTEFFNDISMEMTRPTNIASTSNICNKENLRMDEPISRDDRTIFFHNVTMEMTKAVSSRKEITQSIISKSIPKENTHEKKDIDNSTCFNEETRSLCKSMELTDVVPVPVYHERTFNTTHIAQSIPFSQIISETHLPVENFVGSVLQTNLVVDKAIQNVSMKITTGNSSAIHHIQDIALNEMKDLNVSTSKTSQHLITNNIIPSVEASLSRTMPNIHLFAQNPTESALQTDAVVNKTVQNVLTEISTAIPPTLHFTQDMTVNEIENSTISKDDEFRHLSINNLTELKKNITEKNFAISKEIVETTNMHAGLPNTFVTLSSLDNLDCSLNTNLENISSKKRTSDENEKLKPKKIRRSFMESQSSKKSSIHLSPSANDNYVNNAGHNEYFLKDTLNHTFKSNLRDSLNEISEYSFLRKSLPYMGDNLVELQSIKPPSFVCLDSEEENSFHKALCENKLQTSTIADDASINNTHNSLNRLTINNVTESECLVNSKSITKEYENFTIVKEKEIPINIDNNQIEDRHKSNITNTIQHNQKADCQTIVETIINDNRINETDRYMANAENRNGESVLSKLNAKHGETVTDLDTHHCASLTGEIEVTDEDQIDEGECTRKRINNDAELRNNIETKEQYSNTETRLGTKQCINLKRIQVINEDQVEDLEEYCKENINNEIKKDIKQKEEYIEERSVAEQCVSAIENESLSKQDPFLSLSQRLEVHAEREDCIWNVYHKNNDRNMIVFGFMANSLLIVTFLSYDLNYSQQNLIKKIKIISRVSDDAGILIRIVHRLILEKINAEMLMHSYKTHEDVLTMLDFVSQDVKLAMDFMFDLRRLDDLNLMEIVHDEISFISRSKRMDIVLRVAIKVKCFDKLTSNDINVSCLLGTIKETDVKNLIKNIKKDHKFLTRYMNDVRDYIDLMEEISK